MCSTLEKTITLRNNVRIFLRGFSQIILLKNSVSGLFFLSAIIASGVELNKTDVILFAVASAILSPVLAYITNKPKEEILNGLWGYNSILYGIALSIFIPLSVKSICLLIVGNLAIVMLTPLLEKMLCGLPVLTLPFILTTWLAIILSSPLASPPSIVENTIITASEYIIASINNYTEIFLLTGVVGGGLVMGGIYISNKIAFLATLLISILSVFLSKYENTLTLSQVVNGFYGYNIILIVISVVVFSRLGIWGNMIIGGISVLLGLVLIHVLSHLSLPLLTLPFVISTWFFLLLNKLVSYLISR